MKKILARVLIISMFVSGAIFLRPTQKAEAFFIDIPNFIKEYGLDTLITIIQNRIINKMVEDTTNWAVGGFDGDPGFIDNWDGFLKDTQYDVIAGTFSLATTAAQNAELNNNSQVMLCEEQVMEPLYDQPCGGDTYDVCVLAWEVYDQQIADCQNMGTPGGQAQQNYDIWASGELTSARAVADTVARFGARQLNYDPLSALISGEGETLSKLLGSNEQKDNFMSDFSAGGIMGYIALADPHNSAIGLQGLVESNLGTKTERKVTSVIQDIQTPQKFLDRTICEVYEKDAEGNDTDKCLRTTTTTPGGIVENKLQQNLIKEEEQSIVARELSDILAQVLGRLTDSLLQKGLDALTKKNSSSGSGNTTPLGSEFDGNYQSAYDVLGLSDEEDPLDPNGGGGSTGTEGGVGDDPFSDPFNTDITDGSAPFVGGPEDVGNHLWNEGPELIVDFREVLDPAIKNTEQELAYYLEAERVLKKLQDVIIKIDRCAPGPNYDWEDRYKDIFDLDTNTSSDGELRKIALQEMKGMAYDSRVNIPGALRMSGLVINTLGRGNEEYEEVTQLRTKKQNVLIQLKNIRSAIQNDFNIYKSTIDTRLPLFIDQWDQLSEADHIALFSLPGIEEFYLFKPEFGETPASVYASDPIAAREAVLRYSWDLWQEQKGLEPETADEPSGIQQKSNIRYRYYIMKNSISTQANVLEAELKKEEVKENGRTIEGFLNDCKAFTSFATGATPEEIDISLASEWFALLINNPSPKTDDQIKAFVEAEKIKQYDEDPSTVSVFVTDVITADGSLSESILGFETEEEKLQYFSDFYPDDGVGVPNALTVVDILKQNYEYSISVWGSRRWGRSKGILFCRMTTMWNSGVTDCRAPWYTTRTIEYMLVMAGINE